MLGSKMRMFTRSTERRSNQSMQRGLGDGDGGGVYAGRSVLLVPRGKRRQWTTKSCSVMATASRRLGPGVIGLKLGSRCSAKTRAPLHAPPTRCPPRPRTRLFPLLRPACLSLLEPASRISHLEVISPQARGADCRHGLPRSRRM